MRATVVLSRCYPADPPRAEREEALIRLCADAGLPLVRMPHLYHLPEDSPLWAELATLPGRMIVLTWLHPRPAEWLLRRHGVGGDSPAAVNITAHADAAACVAAVRALLDDAAVEPVGRRDLDAPVLERWYPVVDRARCADCGHCLQFCLFGVHGRDAEGRVVVENPDHCKPGCPACSRICPHGAIMFPLYADDAVAGAPGLYMTPDDAARRMFAQRTARHAAPLTLMPGLGSLSPQRHKGHEEDSGVGLQDATVGAGLQPSTLNTQPSTSHTSDPVRDEIDALLDDLDDLARRGF